MNDRCPISFGMVGDRWSALPKDRTGRPYAESSNVGEFFAWLFGSGVNQRAWLGACASVALGKSDPSSQDKHFAQMCSWLKEANPLRWQLMDCILEAAKQMQRSCTSPTLIPQIVASVSQTHGQPSG